MNSKFLTHLLQGRIVELFPIIGDDRVWDSEPADYVSPDEVYALCLGDHGEWFCFYPFGEVIDFHDGKLSLCLRSKERADQVYPLFYKRPGADDRREWFEGLF